MAEFDTYHDQRGENVTQMAVEYLDSEIELYDQVIQKLRNAGSAFTAEGAELPEGPRQPSQVNHILPDAPGAKFMISECMKRTLEYHRHCLSPHLTSTILLGYNLSQRRFARVLAC
ncbi:hypothetical protein BDV93DRAFT_527560 [Ceratobasidium sp. AG-I]|nr:hypothetical protein BDV93DRAFT_527560 [Ceratobasidium sp. AG-I]